MHTWSLSSWTHYLCSQGIEYPDADARDIILKKLQHLPALITLKEIKQLTEYITKAQHQEVFLLQGGDCAESFQHCHPDVVKKKLKIMQQMSALLSNSLRKPIIQMGRIAGQFAKARSDDLETRQGITLPSYRGDLINGAEFTLEARVPNPARLLEGYDKSAQTLHMIQTQKNHPDSFFTSHEALHLPYEQALTRHDDETKQWYLSSTHLPWIGVRTNSINSAHLEFVRGVTNPVGIKIGPQATPDWLYEVLCRLNPHRLSGRILLITRFGTDSLSECLPPLISLVKQERFPVTWSCDPMHGNTKLTDSGLKTREVETILKELQHTLNLHQQHGSHLAGVHLELTGDNVTECIGGARGIQEHHLPHAYHSLVDPRLNYEQSLEVALQLGLMHA